LAPQHELFGAPPRAAPATGATRDAAHRRRAVTEFERPLLLEAGAGTGKTATLVARMVHWCLGPGWEHELERGDPADDPAHAGRVLAGVAAMTFTEAAAAEMSSRVERALSRVEAFAAGRGELPPGFERAVLPADAAVLGRRARALRAALDHLNVGTIHAFCRRLLAAHPLEAGLRAEFEVDATLQQAELAVRDAVVEILRADWEAGTDGEWIALARRRASPVEVEAAAVALIAEKGARSSDFGDRDPLPEELCARAVSALGEAARELALRARPLERFRRERFNTRFALEALDDTLSALAGCGAPSRAALVALVPRLREAWSSPERAKGWKKLDEWRKDGPNVGEGKELADHDSLRAAAAALRAALEPFLELDPELLELARSVLGRVLARAEDLLRERGVATFSDLLAGACALLRDPRIAARERARVRQLLVDEFQDTDQEQCEIIGRLGLEGSGRPGLFLVGDPKQSIFAWRNADLAAYDDFAERLTAAGGEHLTLDANFRSHAGILEEVQRLVEPVMEARRGLQPGFVALQPAHPAARRALAGPAVEHWISWTRDPATGAIVTGASKVASYASEARALARDIAARRALGLRLSDCAVILRSMTGVEVYLRELRIAGVPYEVQSDRRYYQRREVLDAAALVRAVLDPTDHAALVGLLRSPAVGLPDAALLPLWAAGFPGEMTRLEGPQPARLARLFERIAGAARQVPADIPGLPAIGAWQQSLEAAVASIARLRGSFRVEPLDRFVEGLREELQGDVAEAARYLGEFRLANLDRFFRELLRSLESSGGDPRPLLRALRSNLGRQDRNEVSRPGDARRDAVQVLTIHAAKGLEFGHVYLVQTHRSVRESARGAEFERRGGEVAYRVLGAPTLAWTLGAQRRAEIEAAERVRLLYVMLTRAAERLVIVGAWPEHVAPRPWPRAQHANDLCCSRTGAAAEVEAVQRAANEGQRAEHVDGWGVTWRLAELEAAPPEPRRTGSSAALERAAAGEEGARVLAAERERARVHAARPFSVVASAEAHIELSELVAARRDDEARGPSALPVGRDAAQTAGTAVHRLLEELALDGDVTANWRRAAEGLPSLIERLATPVERARALARARELAERVAAGGLLDRLAAIGPLGIVAREPYLLVPPDRGGTSAVGFVSGAVDLVYREAGGELVVVDYKSDLAETEEALAGLGRIYRPQAAAYADALRAALALDHLPRCELWFLHSGRVVTV
jgi:ATP-dependent exoDNAse (exonuclease V) beta subunit